MARDSLDDMTADRYGGDEPGFFRSLPGDAAVVLLYTVAAWMLLTSPSIRGTPLQFLIGLPYVMFVPGYALLAALFPGRPTQLLESLGPFSNAGRAASVRSIQERGLTWGERAALSFGLSIVLVPLLALVLAVLPWGFDLLPILAIVGVFVVAFTAIGVVRRLRLPRNERYSVPLARWVSDLHAGLTRSGTDAVVNLVLIVAVLAALSSVTYALAVPNDGTQFSELYLVTENDSGETVAADYPTSFSEGESRQLTVGVENHEDETTDYTVVVQLQRARTDGNAVTVLERQELDRLQTTVGANETWETRHAVTPTMVGEDLRLTYLLYEGEPPADPTMENAKEHVYLWIDVGSGG